MQYSIVPLAHVRVAGSDFNVYISVCTTTRHMHVFKYNDHCCEYEIFDQEGQACEFIERPMPGRPSKRL